MMKAIPDDLIKEITRRLVAEFQPEQVILFGSHAWGTPNDDSDIDLCVIVSESDEPPIERAVRGYRCLRGLGVSKDILVKTRAEIERYYSVYASLERQILEQGKVLCGRRQEREGTELAHRPCHSPKTGRRPGSVPGYRHLSLPTGGRKSDQGFPDFSR